MIIDNNASDEKRERERVEIDKRVVISMLHLLVTCVSVRIMSRLLTRRRYNLTLRLDYIY